MKRQYPNLILESLATAAFLITFYTSNPIVGIAVTPLAIYCLIKKYKDIRKIKIMKKRKKNK